MVRRSMFNNLSICFGAISAICCIISRYVSNSPLELIHLIDNRNIIPSILLFNILSVSLYFLIGTASGGIICASSKKLNLGMSLSAAYRGGLFFITSFFLGLIWYPLFFSCEHLMLSLVVSFISLISAIICASNWSCVNPRSSSVIMVSFCIWMFYIMFISLSVIIQN